MFELISVAKNTYYINYPSKIGLYKNEDDSVYIIDSGNTALAGKHVVRLLKEKGWSLRAVINTHSNTDHIGGNAEICGQMGCKPYANGSEIFYIRYPILGAAFLYGAYPCKRMQRKSFIAEPSDARDIKELDLPGGFTYFPLYGHCHNMIGLRTPDDIVFLADALISLQALQNAHISYIFDVKNYIKTLNDIKSMSAALFIPSHDDPVTDIVPLAQANLDKVKEIAECIFSFCKEPISTEDIIAKTLNRYALSPTFNDYMLLGSTIRSYISFLYDEKRLEPEIKDNILYWRHV